MIVAVPYVEGRLHPRTLPSIDAQGYSARTLPIVSTYSARLAMIFVSLFAGNDVAIIEHDVESRAGFLDSYESCPMALCYHAYALGTPFDQTWAPFVLGHSRFRSHLGPRLLELANTDRWQHADWRECESLILEWLRIVPHRHEGDAVHHHDYAHLV